MNTSSELFKGRAFEVFDTGKVNEFILVLYAELGLAIRDNVDLLILDRNALTHFIHDRIVREWPMVYGKTSIYEMARKSLLQILEVDSLIQELFQLDQVSENELKIKVRVEKKV